MIDKETNMDKISRISFNGTFNVPKKSVNEDIKEKEEQKQPENTQKQVEPDKILEAMNYSGVLNLVNTKVPVINPKDYLSEDRINDIENSMKNFQIGVDENLKALNDEFGELPEFKTLNEADKLAMAAQAFASA